MTTTLLIADDDSAFKQSIRLALFGDPFDISETSTLEETLHAVRASPPDLLLLDVHFRSGKTSLQLLQQFADEGIAIPIIMLSGEASPSEAVQAVRKGAFDFLEKPVSPQKLKLTIERCLEHSRMRGLIAGLTTTHNVATEFIGRSQEATEIRQQIARLARKDVRVLITGETGVGKEVVAQALWKESQRARKPLIVVNAAAIPETLIESELFGHKKGSFTGASADHCGKVEMAHEGTLFLDEIGDLSKASQTKLLRFLETGEVQKVGASKVDKADVRVISATSRNLDEEIEHGRFRSDLYYRINVSEIRIPPLRERRDDIEPLFEHFLGRAAARYEEPKPKILQVATDLLTSYSWPGNVRELRNVAERAVLQTNGTITVDALRSIMRMGPQKPASSCVGGSLSGAGEGQPGQGEALQSLKEYKQRMEKEYVERVLAFCNNSVSRAAEILDVDRTYLHQVMARLGIRRKD